MTIRLYHHPFSFNARRAVMTALHLGIDVELVYVDLAKGEQRTPEFLAKNPAGRVPVLEDGDFLLGESHAIMQYLGDKKPSELYPREARTRADVHRWMFWSANHFGPSVAILGWEHMVKKFLDLGPADPAEVRRGEQLVSANAKVLDGHLANRKWLVGDRLTLADIAVATPLMMRDKAALPIGEYSNLLTWHARVQELDAWKKTDL